MPWFGGREVLLPFAWQKDCVISDKVRKAPEATSSRLPTRFDFLNISFPPFTQPLPTCHLCCWVNTVCLLYRATGCCTCRASGGGAGVGCYARCVCVVLGGGCCRDLVCGQVLEAICIFQWVPHLCLTSEIPFPNTLLPPSPSDTQPQNITPTNTERLRYFGISSCHPWVLVYICKEHFNMSLFGNNILFNHSSPHSPLINTKEHKPMTCPFA